jgi:hypothetical protein
MEQQHDRMELLVGEIRGLDTTSDIFTKYQELSREKKDQELFDFAIESDLFETAVFLGKFRNISFSINKLNSKLVRDVGSKYREVNALFGYERVHSITGEIESIKSKSLEASQKLDELREAILNTCDVEKAHVLGIELNELEKGEKHKLYTTYCELAESKSYQKLFNFAIDNIFAETAIYLYIFHRAVLNRKRLDCGMVTRIEEQSLNTSMSEARTKTGNESGLNLQYGSSGGGKRLHMINIFNMLKSCSKYDSMHDGVGKCWCYIFKPQHMERVWGKILRIDTVDDEF